MSALPAGFSPPPGWTVRFDPDHPMRGQTFTEEREIVLQAWHPEVFLHECLHALIRDGGFRISGQYDDNEESFVRWISKALEAAGFTAAPAVSETPSAVDRMHNLDIPLPADQLGTTGKSKPSKFAPGPSGCPRSDCYDGMIPATGRGEDGFDRCPDPWHSGAAVPGEPT